jgi:hypothetical protein
LLAVLADGDHVSFIVLMWAAKIDGDLMLWEQVFRGCGPSGSLRELRHTWWGENGYIYYVNGELITDAFAKLRQWFDLD